MKRFRELALVPGEVVAVPVAVDSVNGGLGINISTASVFFAVAVFIAVVHVSVFLFLLSGLLIVFRVSTVSNSFDVSKMFIIF